MSQKSCEFYARIFALCFFTRSIPKYIGRRECNSISREHPFKHPTDNGAKELISSEIYALACQPVDCNFLARVQILSRYYIPRFVRASYYFQSPRQINFRRNKHKQTNILLLFALLQRVVFTQEAIVARGFLTSRV